MRKEEAIAVASLGRINREMLAELYPDAGRLEEVLEFAAGGVKFSIVTRLNGH